MSTSPTVCRILDMSSAADRRSLQEAIRKRRIRSDAVQATAARIVEAVRSKGDAALFRFAARFDNVRVNRRTVRMDPRSFARLGAAVPPALKAAIRAAVSRLRVYHRRQRIPEFSLRTAEGLLQQRVLPIGRVGLYVPGGHTIYPSTVLMNVVPARVAGVKEIAVVTPCRGGLDPVLAFIFDMLDVEEVYQVGGAQAIAALAYGTASVRAVDKIVGPGNAYVTAAKKLVVGDVDIDSLAGPSEVVILADSSARPDWVAADLLSQAEHGTGDEMAFCVTESSAYAARLQQAVEAAVRASPVQEVFANLAAYALCICVCPGRGASIEFINQAAPEHLQIMTRTPRRDLAKVTNAAAVFLGPYTPVPFGDYYIGTNHVLPTAGGARFGSPLGVPSFLKRMSVAEMTASGAAGAAKNTAILARAERFEHHAISVECRSR